MTTDLRNALEEIAAMTYDARTNGARAGEIARVALAAAPSPAPDVQQEAPSIGTDGKAWPETFDGQAWARAFAQKFPNGGYDEGDLIAWFANAIMRGWDDAKNVAPPPSPSAAEQAGRWMPVARVADVHMSRYTIEWLDKPMPEGTVLFADVIEWAANAPRRRREAAGFESGLVQLLNEARCLSKETVGNRELASRIIRYMRMHDPQPVAPAGQAAAGVQGDAVAWRVRYSPNGLWHLSHSRCADDVYERQPLGVIAPAPAVERGVAEELADFKKWKEDKGKSCHSGRFTPSPMEAWLARAALSTAGKEQA